MHLLILGWNSQNPDYGFLQTAPFKRLLLAGFSKSSLKVPIVAISDLFLSNRLYNTRSHPLSLSLTNTHAPTHQHTHSENIYLLVYLPVLSFRCRVLLVSDLLQIQIVCLLPPGFSPITILFSLSSLHFFLLSFANLF